LPARYNKTVMKTLKLYLDTSVISAAVDEREPEKRTITRRLLAEIKRGEYESFISELVTAEIDRAGQKDAIRLRAVINDLNPERLFMIDEAKVLADKYVKAKIIPARYINDAVHIALASINDLDVIVSWNFKHMVKVKTKLEVRGVNTLMGYKEIEIYSPLEVVKNV